MSRLPVLFSIPAEKGPLDMLRSSR